MDFNITACSYCAAARIVQAAVPKLLLLQTEAKPPALLGFGLVSVTLQTSTLGRVQWHARC